MRPEWEEDEVEVQSDDEGESVKENHVIIID